MNFIAEASTASSTNMNSLIVFALAAVFFYFFLYRPESQRRKKLEEKRASIQVGSRIIALGIKGVVDEIKEESVLITTCGTTKLEVLKEAITDVEKVVEENTPPQA